MARARDLASEAECEDEACQAHKVFWSTEHGESAADFVQVMDAELDAFASESRTTKQQGEQHPAPPVRLDDWVSRVTRQNQVWALTYGMEFLEVRQHALELMSGWRQELPHKWPLQIVMDAWEELHWRFIEEMKELLRQLKKTAKRESMSLSEIRFHALLPGPRWPSLVGVAEDVRSPQSIWVV